MTKKRRFLLRVAVLLLLATTLLLTLAYHRLHIPHASSPRLANLQWNANRDIPSTTPPPQIIGHRAAALTSTSGDILIGNSPNAIQYAIDAKVDWIEIDIRQTSDGHLVVFHDESIDRKTNRSGKVAELTLAELQKAQLLLDPPEQIITLQETFAKFPDPDLKWIIDIKSKGIHDQLLPLLNQHQLKHQPILFGTEDILADYQSANYRLGLIIPWSKTSNKLQALFTPNRIIQRALDLDATYLVLPIIFSHQSLLDSATAARLEVWTYGTNDRTDLRHNAHRGIQGLIVDRPNATRNFLW